MKTKEFVLVMATAARSTIGEHLFWAYANLGMAEHATHARVLKYGRVHYMIRAKVQAGVHVGRGVAGVMKDQKVRMKLPQECLYCGGTEKLSVDHVIPTQRGGADSGDNAVWACRACNSANPNRDLFEWWATRREQAGSLHHNPPLFAIRIYLKQAIAHFAAAGLLDRPLSEAAQSPFDLSGIPAEYPDLAGVIFTPWHARRPPLPSGENPSPPMPAE